MTLVYHFSFSALIALGRFPFSKFAHIVKFPILEI